MTVSQSYCRLLTEHRTVPLECIKEIRSGEDARYYRKEYEQPEEAESRWITVVYILHGTYKTLHILADTRDVFKTWDTTLRKLYSVRQGLTAGLNDPDMRQAVWERQYWKGADEEGDQLLDLDDVERLCQRLHANIPVQQLRIYFTVRIRVLMVKITFDSMIRKPMLRTRNALTLRVSKGSSGRSSRGPISNRSTVKLLVRMAASLTLLLSTSLSVNHKRCSHDLCCI